MKNELANASLRERHAVSVKFIDGKECARAISAATTRQANEISQPRGESGSDRENWIATEKEILQPLCCGFLDSREEAIVSIFCSDLGLTDLEQIAICVEPHRLIVAAKNGSNAGSGGNAAVYRVLPFADEIDPSSASATLRQHGKLLEIQLHKLGKQSLVASRAG